MCTWGWQGRGHVVMIKNVNPKQTRESLAIAGNLMLAPAVAAMRLPTLVLEAQSSNPWRTETLRAFTEKTAAVAEGAFAAQMSLVQSAFGFWPEVMSGRTPSVLSGVAAGRSMNAALKPASLRVKANFKR
jgi:hypothetical protein